MKRIILAADHAGVHLKDFIKNYLKKTYEGVDVLDVGTSDEDSCHYPEFAKKMCNQIGSNDRGIAVCGSGIGIGIAVNKAGIKCSTAFNEYTAKECGKLCQVMAIGERLVTKELAEGMIQQFLQNWLKQ